MKRLKLLFACFLVLILGLFFLAPATPVRAEELKVAVGNYWPSSLFLAGVIMAESEMAGLPYEFVIDGYGYSTMYEKVKDGSADFHTVGWLPNTHAAVWPDPKLVTAGVQIADTWLGYCLSREKAIEVAKYLEIYENPGDEESLTLTQVLKEKVLYDMFSSQLRVYEWDSGLKTRTKDLLMNKLSSPIPTSYWVDIGYTDDFDAAIANGELVSWWTPHVVFAKRDIVKLDDDLVPLAYPTDDGVSCVYATANPLARDLKSLLEGLSFPVEDFQAMMYEYLVDNEKGDLDAIELGADDPLQQTAENIAVWWKIKTLIAMVEGYDLPAGIAKSLVSKLSNAKASLSMPRKDAAKKLNAFINQCKAQKGKKLDPEDADDLIELAENIIDDLQ